MNVEKNVAEQDMVYGALGRESPAVDSPGEDRLHGSAVNNYIKPDEFRRTWIASNAE